eukprot:scaffold97298_cov63-Attheya_sp.AAC.3
MFAIGNYAAYSEGKEARLANEDAVMASTKKKFSSESAWMRQQPTVVADKPRVKRDNKHSINSKQ